MFYYYFSFFFNATATTEIYTLSLHDALPILWRPRWFAVKYQEQYWNVNYRTARTAVVDVKREMVYDSVMAACQDRKSTRLNSSHPSISYAVFCLKKKNKIIQYSLSASTHLSR